MSKQQNLHRTGLAAVAYLERIIDDLKAAGPCPMDGQNALLNLRQQIEGLLNRFPADETTTDNTMPMEGWSVVPMADTILCGTGRLARFEIRGPNRQIPGNPAYPPLLATVEQDWGMDRAETAQVAHAMGAVPHMLAGLYDAKRLLRAAGYTMEGTATARILAAIAKAEGGR